LAVAGIAVISAVTGIAGGVARVARNNQGPSPWRRSWSSLKLARGRRTDDEHRGARPAGNHPGLGPGSIEPGRARAGGPPELTAAAGELLAATGLTAGPRGPLRELGTSTPRQIASQAAAVLHRASALASGRGYHWGAQSDETLLAQGNASAQAAVPTARFLLPMTGDLADRLAAPGARMLDAGTGVAAAAVGFAQLFP